MDETFSNFIFEVSAKFSYRLLKMKKQFITCTNVILIIDSWKNHDQHF